jgi:hypothetical protein
MGERPVSLRSEYEEDMKFLETLIDTEFPRCRNVRLKSFIARWLIWQAKEKPLFVLRALLMVLLIHENHPPGDCSEIRSRAFFPGWNYSELP